MKKEYYVIREDGYGRKEKVFSGTIDEAIELQEFWGIEESDKVKIEDVEDISDLLQIHYFGDDEYFYKEVDAEEYENTPTYIKEW
jgi:hypothetical protein